MMGLTKHAKILPHPLSNGEVWDDGTPRYLHPLWRSPWAVNANAWLDEFVTRVQTNPHSYSTLSCADINTVPLPQLHECAQIVWTSMKKNYLKANGSQDDATDKASESRKYQRKVAVRTCCFAKVKLC